MAVTVSEAQTGGNSGQVRVMESMRTGERNKLMGWVRWKWKPNCDHKSPFCMLYFTYTFLASTHLNAAAFLPKNTFHISLGLAFQCQYAMDRLLTKSNYGPFKKKNCWRREGSWLVGSYRACPDACLSFEWKWTYLLRTIASDVTAWTKGRFYRIPSMGTGSSFLLPKLSKMRALSDSVIYWCVTDKSLQWKLTGPEATAGKRRTTEGLGGKTEQKSWLVSFIGLLSPIGTFTL